LLGRSWIAEHLIMPGSVEDPTLLPEAVDPYGALFANEAQRRHFAEDLTGLFVAERKTVLGLPDEFAQTTDQSCLHRFLTHVAWQVKDLNLRRLDLLREDPGTRSSDPGVLPIENTLIDREGRLIPDAGGYGDHAEERHQIAQDYLVVNSVGTRGKPSPREFRLVRQEEVGAALKEPFRKHPALGCEVIDWVCAQTIPGDFARDCSFTTAEVLTQIPGKKDRFAPPRGSVGDLKTNRKREWKGRTLTARESAASLPAAERKELRIGDERQWYFPGTVRIPGVNPKVRLVILWRSRKEAEPCQVLVTKRTNWEVSRSVRVDRRRGTGTETFHRDGQQHLGRGACQLRDDQGQTRHISLVMRASSLLMGQLKQSRAKEGALPRLMTLGEACRAMLKETLRTTLAGAIDHVTERGLSFDRVVAQLSLI
jgi:hypothetical protein